MSRGAGAGREPTLANGNIPHHGFHAQLMNEGGWGQEVLSLFLFL